MVTCFCRSAVMVKEETLTSYLDPMAGMRLGKAALAVVTLSPMSLPTAVM